MIKCLNIQIRKIFVGCALVIPQQLPQILEDFRLIFLYIYVVLIEVKALSMCQIFTCEHENRNIFHTKCNNVELTRVLLLLMTEDF
jgi:hypothetical protein